MADLTLAQIRALRFLDDKMFANTRAIGAAILGDRYAEQVISCILFGTKVMSDLRRKGLVIYLSDVSAWRITAAGRTALERGMAVPLSTD